MPNPTLLHCPVHIVADVVPCPSDELEPLLAHLRENRAADETITFPRGTILADGRLDLCKQSLGPGGCRAVTHALIGNRAVRSLLLGTDGIGDEGAADVAELIESDSGLEIAYLGCNRIGSAGVERLCAAASRPGNNLKGLWLKRNPIESGGASALASMLRRNTALRVLDIVNTGIDLDGLSEIADALIVDNRTLERLYVGGNGIEADGAAVLAEILCANPVLKSLQLNVNHIGDKGALALADALRENHTLEALGIASCGISFTGAAAIFDAIADHPTLIDLDLGYSPSTRALNAPANDLGAFGAEAVAAYLATDPPLRRLRLNGTGIGRTGREPLLAALENNTHLTHLRIEWQDDPRLITLLQRNRDAASASGASPSIPLDLGIRSVYRTA